VCGQDAEPDAGRASPDALAWLDAMQRVDLYGAGDMTPPPELRREARAMLYGFTEYYFERRMRSFGLLARQPAPPLADEPMMVPEVVPAS
jgi:hypothetical protein